MTCKSCHSWANTAFQVMADLWQFYALSITLLKVFFAFIFKLWMQAFSVCIMYNVQMKISTFKQLR